MYRLQIWSVDGEQKFRGNKREVQTSKEYTHATKHKNENSLPGAVNFLIGETKS